MQYPKRMGILGGGQLGKMMLPVAMGYDLEVHIMDPDPSCPCAKWTPHFFKGDLRNEADVVAFGQRVDILTIEFEHVNVPALKTLVAQGKQVYPQPEVIEILQDKAQQNQFYLSQAIPTPEFVVVDQAVDLSEYAYFLPAVQKLRFLGYDGKGVVKLKNTQDLCKGFSEPSLLEKWVDIDYELSVLVVQNLHKTQVVYPPVQVYTHPTSDLLDYLISPAPISSELSQKAEAIAKKIAKKLGIVGILAVEFFLTKSGELLVNECAPRPHNSGHHTIEAFDYSQFDQHIRAVLGLPLHQPTMIAPSIMKNILGTSPENWDAFQKKVFPCLAWPSSYLHWYGKESSKPFRKMGHLTVLADSVETLNDRLQSIHTLLGDPL